MKSLVFVVIIVLVASACEPAIGQDLFEFHIGMSKKEVISMFKSQHVQFDSTVEGAIDPKVTDLHSDVYRVYGTTGTILISFNHFQMNDRVEMVVWGKDNSARSDYKHIVSDFNKRFGKTGKERRWIQPVLDTELPVTCTRWNLSKNVHAQVEMWENNDLTKDLKIRFELQDSE